jgi:hypothetical protein
MLGRFFIFIKENDKISFVENRSLYYRHRIEIALNKIPPLLPKEDGFYIILLSDRCESINLGEYISKNNWDKYFKKFKIGVSTKIEGDSDNIIPIIPIYLLNESDLYLSKYDIWQKYTIFIEWKNKINDLIYMGGPNSNFRKKVISDLKNLNFKNLLLIKQGLDKLIPFEYHLKYKFILDLASDHQYVYDHSWFIFRKFLTKGLIFHIEPPKKIYTYYRNNFVDRQDWVVCSDIEDFISKYNYYLNNQDEAKQIAINGFNKIFNILNQIPSKYSSSLKECKNDLSLLENLKPLLPNRTIIEIN